MYRVLDLGKTDARVKGVSFEPWVSEAQRLRDNYPTLRGTLREARIDWAIIGANQRRTKRVPGLWISMTFATD